MRKGTPKSLSDKESVSKILPNSGELSLRFAQNPCFLGSAFKSFRNFFGAVRASFGFGIFLFGPLISCYAELALRPPNLQLFGEKVP